MMSVWLSLWISLAAQPPPEVRQLVTFQFLPGKSSEAIRIFRDEAIPLYQANEPMKRFRGYRETESPIPLDLMVVSTFEGMAGMDRSNQALRAEAEKRNTSVGSIYGRIGALATAHTDQFVEIHPGHSWGKLEDARLVVFVSMQAVAGERGRLDALLANEMKAWEQELPQGVVGADGGTFILSDGWTHLRIVGVDSLGAWHDYVRARSKQSWFDAFDRAVVASQQIILTPVDELAVR